MSRQQQEDDDDQDDAENTYSTAAEAIAVAAEAATEATKQEDDKEDDENESKRHDVISICSPKLTFESHQPPVLRCTQTAWAHVSIRPSGSRDDLPRLDVTPAPGLGLCGIAHIKRLCGHIRMPCCAPQGLAAEAQVRSPSEEIEVIHCLSGAVEPLNN
jgi:hypothetical protein